ncbi:hypothetical protein IW150_004730 [Coemansia sp. RSA 2607]|nr:hypothetical protein IW150_004730 [Coemansia sp. RSA 2607]
MADAAGSGTKLSKKQLKHLQFRGKIDKPIKTSETIKPKGKKGKLGDKPKGKKGKLGDKPKEKISKKRKRVLKEFDEKIGKPLEKAKFEKRTNGAGNAIRFIAFVGNIPFKTTAEELKKIMKSANPVSVRLGTHKDTGKSRGFAFVEFGSSSDLKTALKFHHHRIGEKKINVELTVGGGGKSETRTKKINERREKLDNERKRTSLNKRQKIDHESNDQTVSEEQAVESSSAGFEKPENASAPPAKRTKTETAAEIENVAPVTRPGDRDQDIEDYDTGASKGKKNVRRKRGRGSSKK